MKKIMSVAVLAVVAIAMAVISQPSVTAAVDDHLIRIRLWTGEDVSKQLAAVAGRQSRDLGSRLRQAAREGKLKPLAGKYEFRVEFRGQPAPFAEPKHIAVINGEGQLKIPSRMVGEDTILVITAPETLGELHYPPPPYRQLRTVPGELARLVREHEASNYHFVK